MESAIIGWNKKLDGKRRPLAMETSDPEV